MYLLIGLGNIGSQYQKTRHNFGFMAIDKIIDKFGLSFYATKFKSEIYLGEIADSKVMAIKPQSFMNLSGDPVFAICNFYKINIDNILLFHDELDIDFGRIKTKIGGGNAGHNGIRSVEQKIGRLFARVRIGIGRPAISNNQENNEAKIINIADYVLSNFSAQELLLINEILQNIADKLELAIKNNKENKIDLDFLKKFDR
jgi:PTH1 family peptidyl-tRNA hydrolase